MTCLEKKRIQMYPTFMHINTNLQSLLKTILMSQQPSILVTNFVQRNGTIQYLESTKQKVGYCSAIDSFLLCSFVTTNISKCPFHYLSAIQTKNLSRDYGFCSQEGRAPGADDGAHDGFTNKIAKIWELLTISWQ